MADAVDGPAFLDKQFLCFVPRLVPIAELVVSLVTARPWWRVRCPVRTGVRRLGQALALPFWCGSPRNATRLHFAHAHHLTP